MRAYVVFSILIILGQAFALGGEKPQIHFTGNRNVDFFGAIKFAPAFTDSDKPMIYNTAILHDGEENKKLPWLAGIMSLVVPGAGEVYSKSYLKGAVFFAAEVTSWIMRITYNKKGDDQEVLFKAYANQHYSAVRYVNWTLNNVTRLNPNPAHTETEYSQKIYGSTIPPTGDSPPFGVINWVELNNMEREIASGVLNGYTHVMPYYGEQQYYELIGKYEQFSRGWDDSDPNDPLESAIPVKTTSKRFKEYAALRAKANDYYDVANTFIAVIVGNHLLSAADAFWTASRFNNSLHASIQMRVQPTPIGYIPFTQANFRYDF